jgi:hypothetical protein
MLRHRLASAQSTRLGGLRSSLRPAPRCLQPTGVRVSADTGWLPSTVMVPSAAIVTA